MNAKKCVSKLCTKKYAKNECQKMCAKMFIKKCVPKMYANIYLFVYYYRKQVKVKRIQPGDPQELDKWIRAISDLHRHVDREDSRHFLNIQDVRHF